MRRLRNWRLKYVIDSINIYIYKVVAFVCVCVCVCVCLSVCMYNSPTAHTTGPIMTKPGMMMVPHLGMVHTIFQGQGHSLISDVNGFFPVGKNPVFFEKKTTKIKKKLFFFLVSRIRFVNNGKRSCLCVK